MAMARRYVEVEEPMVEERRRPGLFGRLFRLILGAIVGLAAAGALLAFPDALGNVWAATVLPLQGLEPGQRTWVIVVILAVLLLIFSKIGLRFLTSALLLGIIVGTVAWLPFGRHILAAVPEINQEVPSLSTGLDAFVARDARFEDLRAWGEATVPIPDALTGGLFGEPDEAVEEAAQSEG